MKKIVMILYVLLFISSDSKSQKRMSYRELNEAVKPVNNQVVLEKWMDHGTGFYGMTFKQSIVGFKKAIDKCRDICNVNGLDFNTPTKEESFLASTVKSIIDYENLYYSVQLGNSIIKKTWYKIYQPPSGDMQVDILVLTIDDESVIVGILLN